MLAAIQKPGGASTHTSTYMRRGSAEPTREKNIIGMYRSRRESNPPLSYVTPVGSSSLVVVEDVGQWGC